MLSTVTTTNGHSIWENSFGDTRRQAIKIVISEKQGTKDLTFNVGQGWGVWRSRFSRWLGN